MKDKKTFLNSMRAAGEAGNGAILVVMILATVVTLGNAAMRAQTDNAMSLLARDQLRIRMRTSSDSGVTLTEHLLATRMVAVDCRRDTFVPGVNANQDVVKMVGTGALTFSSCANLTDAAKADLFKSGGDISAAKNCDATQTNIALPKSACGDSQAMQAEITATTAHYLPVATTTGAALSVSLAAANLAKVNRNAARPLNVAAASPSSSTTSQKGETLDPRSGKIDSRALLPLPPESLCAANVPTRRVQVRTHVPGTGTCGWRSRLPSGKFPKSPSDYDWSHYHGYSSATATITELAGVVVCNAQFSFENKKGGRELYEHEGDVFVTWNGQVILATNGRAVGYFDGVGPTRQFSWTNLESQEFYAGYNWCPVGAAKNSNCQTPSPKSKGGLFLSLDLDIVRALFNPGGVPMSIDQLASIPAPVLATYAVGIRDPKECTSTGSDLLIVADVLDPAPMIAKDAALKQGEIDQTPQLQ